MAVPKIHWTKTGDPIGLEVNWMLCEVPRLSKRFAVNWFVFDQNYYRTFKQQLLDLRIVWNSYSIHACWVFVMSYRTSVSRMQKSPAISNPDCLESPAISNKYLPNQGIVFFARSDWLLKLGIVFAIHLPASFWISQASFCPFFRRKGAVWCWLSTGLVYILK